MTLLKLQFLEDRRNPPDVAQEMCVDEAVPHVMIQRLRRTHRGLRIGRRLIKSFDNMSRFAELRLKFEPGFASVTAWSMLVLAPVLPRLQTLDLEVCDMDLRDYTEFMLQQINTLRSLRIQALILRNGTIDDLGRLYARLSQFSKIEIMCHERIYVDIFQMIR